MKKILLTICLAVASLTTFAQYYDEPTVTFGVKGGANMVNMQASIAGDFSASGTTKSIVTFTGGLFADIRIDDYFTLQPALLFTGKGGKMVDEIGLNINIGEDEGADVTSITESKYTLYYAHVPLNLLYNVPAGDNKFYFGAGPYASYAITGKIKTTTTGADEEAGEVNGTTSRNVQFGDGEEQIKRLDYGVGALIGFKFYTGFSVNFNYEFGLASISTQKYSDGESSLTSKLKNRGFGLSVGYSF